MIELPTIAVQHKDIIRAVAQPGAESLADLARQIGKDRSNTKRAIGHLVDEGLLERDDGSPLPVLTEAGMAAKVALDRAEGLAELPPGVVILRHDQIRPHPLNPRKDFESDEAIDALAELRESIVTRRAVRQNLEVYPPDANGVHYLVAGERRWRAVGEAIHDGDLPGDFPLLCVVKDPGDAATHLFDALDENLQRRNLSELEEARAFQLLREQGQSTAEIADRVHRSQKHVQDRLKLLTLPEETLALLETGEISYTQARHLMQEHRPAPPAPRPPPKSEPEPEPLKLSAKQALVLVELADKCERMPTDYGFMGQEGYTTIADQPIEGAAGDLLRDGIIGVRRGPGDHRGFARVYLHSKGARAWLEEAGFYQGEGERAALLRHVRAAVVGEPKADAAAEAGRYITAWLNVEPKPGASILPGGDASWAAPETAQQGAEAPRPRPPEPEQPHLLEPSAEEEAAMAQAKAAERDRIDDERAVDEFAAIMKAKLATARAKGRGGWPTAPVGELAASLVEHVSKGDPVDVANFCMMVALRTYPNATTLRDAATGRVFPQGPLSGPPAPWVEMVRAASGFLRIAGCPGPQRVRLIAALQAIHHRRDMGGDWGAEAFDPPEVALQALAKPARAAVRGIDRLSEIGFAMPADVSLYTIVGEIEAALREAAPFLPPEGAE